MKARISCATYVVLVPLVLIVVGILLYLFRDETLDNENIGIITYKRKWGVIREAHVDGDRNGIVDTKVVYDRFSFTKEMWEDLNQDGLPDLHGVVGADGDVEHVRADRDFDGVFDFQYSGPDAGRVYKNIWQPYRPEGTSGDSPGISRD